jgi:hypothetical protein
MFRVEVFDKRFFEMDTILLIIGIVYGVCRIVIHQYNNALISYFL